MRPPLRPARRHGALVALLAAALSVPAPAPAAGESKAGRYYEDALGRYDRRDYEGAVLQLRNALQADREMMPAQLLLGKALTSTGDLIAAEAAFIEAEQLGVNRTESVLPMARISLMRGRPDDLIRQPRFKSEGLPGTIQAQLLLLKAAAAADMGESRMAAQMVADARAIEPSSPESWLTEAGLRVRERQFDAAASAADRALALAPRSVDAMVTRGMVAHVQGDRPGALDWYDKAIAAEPGRRDARLARAGLNLDLDRLDEAASDLAALAPRPLDDPTAAYLRAQIAERKGDRAAADAALREVTALIDPLPPAMLRYRGQLLLLNGMAHFALNEPLKALSPLEQFQRLAPNTPATKLLAQAYFAGKKIQRGIEALDGYVRANPDDSQALAMLASAEMARGRNARATGLMQEALKRSDTPEFNTVLGLSLMRAGQTEFAIAQLEAAYGKDPTQIQAATTLAGLYLQGHQTAKALGVAQSLVRREPQHAGLANLLGVARTQAGDRAGAKAAFETALRLDPKLTLAGINLARLDIAANSYGTAEARLRSLLRADERSADAMFELAVVSERRGQDAEAQRWLEKAMYVSGRKDLRAALALVDLHMRKGRKDQALELAKSVMAKAPNDVATVVATARAQRNAGDAAAARVLLASASRLAGFKAPMQVEIAGLQIAAADLKGAWYSLDKALSDQPELLNAQAMMAEVEARQGEYAKAEQRTRQIVKQYPQRAIGHMVAGATAMAQGQTAAAIDAYRRAHQVEPSSETTQRLFLAMLPTDPPGAARIAELWIKIHPGDDAVRALLGQGYARIGNYAAARGVFEQLAKKAPDDARAVNNLANALLRLGDPSALKTAEQALALAPADAAIIDTVGWAAFSSGANDRALQALRDARLRDPANPTIGWHLGAVLAKSDRTSEARSELEQALASNRAFDGRGEAEALLATLRR